MTPPEGSEALCAHCNGEIGVLAGMWIHRRRSGKRVVWMATDHFAEPAGVVAV